jgi:hypothetical protein
MAKTTDADLRRISRLTPEQADGAIRHRLNYNAGSISLPILGFHIGGGHTAFAGDKVWSDSMIYEKPLTLMGWADGPVISRAWRVLLTEEVDGAFAPDELFPSRLLAAQSRRRKILRIYKKRVKWARLYRQGIREMDAIIAAEKRAPARGKAAGDAAKVK